MLKWMLFWKLVLAILNLEFYVTTYNGIEGGKTKQKDGAHDHGNKRWSIVISNGNGTLANRNGDGEGHQEIE